MSKLKLASVMKEAESVYKGLGRDKFRVVNKAGARSTASIIAGTTFEPSYVVENVQNQFLGSYLEGNYRSSDREDAEKYMAELISFLTVEDGRILDTYAEVYNYREEQSGKRLVDTLGDYEDILRGLAEDIERELKEEDRHSTTVRGLVMDQVAMSKIIKATKLVKRKYAHKYHSIANYIDLYYREVEYRDEELALIFVYLLSNRVSDKYDVMLKRVPYFYHIAKHFIDVVNEDEYKRIMRRFMRNRLEDEMFDLEESGKFNIFFDGKHFVR